MAEIGIYCCLCGAHEIGKIYCAQQGELCLLIALFICTYCFSLHFENQVIESQTFIYLFIYKNTCGLMLSELAPLYWQAYCSFIVYPHILLFSFTPLLFFLQSNDTSNKQLANSKSNFCLFPFPLFTVAHNCDKHCCRTFCMKICISRGSLNYHVFGSLFFSYSP